MRNNTMPRYVINPLTGRKIQYGGKLYRDLVMKGYGLRLAGQGMGPRRRRKAPRRYRGRRVRKPAYVRGGYPAYR